MSSEKILPTSSMNIEESCLINFTMPLNTPDFDKIDEPQSSAGSFLNAGRGSTEIALMTKSLKSHGIDVSNLHA